MNPFFLQIALVIILATGFALLARLFRQPPLIGYIVAGITLGPLGARLIHTPELLDAMRQIGVALLLFLVGLELDWKIVKSQLQTVSTVGAAQIIVSLGTGLLLAYLVHLPLLDGIYIGLALSFASTIIVVKVLSEGRDLNSLHGRLSVGLLLFQDAAAVIALTVLGSLSQVTSFGLPMLLSLLLLKIIAFGLLMWLISVYLLPYLFGHIARSSELLFLSSLAWCFIFSLSMTVYGLPLELGALMAGISLAALPYSLDIVNRLRSLRDFFVILLFVALGSSLAQPSPGYLVFTVLLLVITLFAKPLFTYLMLISGGYTSRTAFLTSLTQGQVGEFAFLLIGVGLTSKQLDPQLASCLTLTAVVSLFVSTVALSHRNALYGRLRGLLRHLEHPNHYRQLEASGEASRDKHIIIFGYHRMGYHILKKLRDLHHQVVIVDMNPEIIQRLRREKVDAVYGDAQDEELLENLQISQAAMVISTIPHREETNFLIMQMKKRRAKGLLIITAHHIDDALDYYQKGADYVILPHVLGGEHVADLITEYEEHQLGALMRHRAEEIKLLRTRKHSLYFD